MQGNHPINIEALFSHVPCSTACPQEIRQGRPRDREIPRQQGRHPFPQRATPAADSTWWSGQIKLSFPAPGERKVVEIISQSQSFGEAIMFMEKPYIVFAQALTDSLLLTFPRR